MTDCQLTFERSTGVFFDPQSFYFSCYFVNFWDFIVIKFSVAVHFFIVLISSIIVCWNVMTWGHDLTSTGDIMAWNDIITSEVPSSISWILFIFLKRTNLDYKNPKMVSSQAVTSWHFHYVMSWRPKHWLFHHSTISGSRHDRAKIFLNFQGFWVKEVNSMQARYVVLTRDLVHQGHVTLQLTSDLSYLIYTC